MYSDTRAMFVMIVPPVILWFYDTPARRAYQPKPSASFDTIIHRTSVDASSIISEAENVSKITASSKKHAKPLNGAIVVLKYVNFLR